MKSLSYLALSVFFIFGLTAGATTEFRNIGGKTYYQILEVDRTASKAEIKQAFRKKMKSVHSDLVGGSKEMAQAVNEAYGVLKDDTSRRAYDRWLPDDAELAWIEKRKNGASADEIRADAFNAILERFAVRIRELESNGYSVSIDEMAFEAREEILANQNFFEWSQIRNIDLSSFVDSHALDFNYTEAGQRRLLIAMAGGAIQILKERMNDGSLGPFAIEASVLIKNKIPESLAAWRSWTRSPEDVDQLKSIARYLDPKLKLVRGKFHRSLPEPRACKDLFLSV